MKVKRARVIVHTSVETEPVPSWLTLVFVFLFVIMTIAMMAVVGSWSHQ